MPGPARGCVQKVSAGELSDTPRRAPRHPGRGARRRGVDAPAPRARPRQSGDPAARSQRPAAPHLPRRVRRRARRDLAARPVPGRRARLRRDCRAEPLLGRGARRLPHLGRPLPGGAPSSAPRASTRHPDPPRPRASTNATSAQRRSRHDASRAPCSTSPTTSPTRRCAARCARRRRCTSRACARSPTSSRAPTAAAGRSGSPRSSPTGPRRRARSSRTSCSTSSPARASQRPDSIAGSAAYYPDLRWPEQRLTVECDSATWHSGKLATEDDADRQAKLEADGERVLRVTYQQALSQPRQTIARLAAAGAPYTDPRS